MGDFWGGIPPPPLISCLTSYLNFLCCCENINALIHTKVCLATVSLKEVLTVLNIIKTLIAMLCVCIVFYSYKVLLCLFWWICRGAEVEWDWEISFFFFFFLHWEKGEIEVIRWLTEIVLGRKGGICDLEVEEARSIKELLRWLLGWNWEPTATQGHGQSVNRNEWKLK